MQKLNYHSTLVTIIFLLTFQFTCYAQEKEEKISKRELKTLIHKIADSLEIYYVNLDMGIKIGNLLKENYKKDTYDKFNNPKELAKQLTTDLRSVNGDKHLYVAFRPIDQASHQKKGSEKIDKSGIWSNYGFQEVQVLDGNIGYVKITNFSDWNYLNKAKEAASAAMNMVSNTDAIIFDVRNNSGGVPYLVAHLASYLFEGERVHLTQYVHRYNNGGYGIYTDANVAGKKRPNVPVFILVNNGTASAAEEFAFWLKNLKRATIIGEVTMGAGYGAMRHRLNDRFTIDISSEVEINPITKTNFEQVGVIPNVKTVKDRTYSEAIALAKIASKEYRKKITAMQTKLLDSLNGILENSLSSMESILNILMACKNGQILDEGKINALGYEYITKFNKTKTAEEILKSNTILYPESANVYDSYAEVLAINEKLSESLINYQKAVEIAKKTNNLNLRLFMENVEKIEKAIENN